jgi:tRNA A37 methylthiotransferase MiaB
VGFSIYRLSLFLSCALAYELKRCNPDIKIVFGGPETQNKHLIHGLANAQYLDHMIVGEGEQKMLEVLDKPNNCRDKVIDGGCVDINSMPAPFFDTNDLQKKHFKVLPYALSRGCVGSCKFCYQRQFFKEYRLKDACKAVGQMTELAKTYNMDTFWMMDSMMQPAQVRRIAKALMAKGANIYWGGYLRADRGFTPELARLMHRSGFRFARIGAESGSQKVLDEMSKHTKIKELEGNISALYCANIHVRLSFIVGFPTESNEDFVKTLDFIINNYHHFNSLAVFRYSEPKNYLKDYLESDSHVTEYRFRVMELLTKRLLKYRADLIEYNPDYRNHTNYFVCTRIFDKDLIYKGRLYNDYVTPVEKTNIKRVPEFSSFDGMRSFFSRAGRFSRPLPLCLLNESKGCEGCVDFLRFINGKLHICRNFDGTFSTRDRPRFEECRGCMHFIRRKCPPCYALGQEKLFKEL